MAGSLATLPFNCADSMQEIIVDNEKIIGMRDNITISIEAKNNFSQFRRQINDTDYVSVSGAPSKSFIHTLYDTILDFHSISPKGKIVLNSSDPRDCEFMKTMMYSMSMEKSIHYLLLRGMLEIIL